MMYSGEGRYVIHDSEQSIASEFHLICDQAYLINFA